MKILKYLCILKNEKDLNEYVRKNQNNSFADDQRTITKNIKFIRDVFDDYGQLDIYFNLSIKYMKDISIWKENKSEINSRIKRYLKSNDSKFTDKETEIENIIQAVVPYSPLFQYPSLLPPPSSFLLPTSHFTLHSSFFILHSSFFILHSSFFILHTS